MTILETQNTETGPKKKFSLTTKEDFAKDIAISRFKGYSFFNYGKKNFFSDVESSFAAGQTNTNEVLLNNYLNKIYPTLNEILLEIKTMEESIAPFWDTRFAAQDTFIEARRYAQTIVNLRYRQADNIKMPVVNLIHDLQAAYISGQRNSLQILLKLHTDNPYESENDILGDLHVQLSKSWKAFRKNHMGRSKPLPLDKIIEEFMKSSENL